MSPARPRAAAVIVLCLLAGAAAAAKTTIVLDGATVGGRDVLCAKRSGKRLRNRTAKTPEDAFLLSSSPNGKRIAWLELLDLTGIRGRLLLARAKRGRGRDAGAGLDGRPLETAWAPNSRFLLFEHRDASSGRSDVYRSDQRGRKRRLLTGGISGSASPPSESTEIRISPDGRLAAFPWERPEGRTILSLDPAKPDSVRDLGAELPEGEPAADPAFLADGTLLFSWRRTDLDETWLYRLDGAELSVEAENITGFLVAGRHFAVARRTKSGAELRAGDASIEGGFTVLGFRLADDGTAAAFLSGEGIEGVRIEVFGPGLTRTVLGNRVIEKVEGARFGPGGRSLLLRVREDGSRRLYHLDLPAGEPREPKAGLPGDLGASTAISPAGDTILFQLLDGTGEGALIAWSKATGESVDLTARSGVPGIPGSGVFSRGIGDLLFSTIAASDGGNRLFLWRRDKDVILPVTPLSLRLGRFFFSR